MYNRDRKYAVLTMEEVSFVDFLDTQFTVA